MCWGEGRNPTSLGTFPSAQLVQSRGPTPAWLVTETIIDQPRINQECTAFTNLQFYSKANEVQPFLHKALSGSQSPARASVKNPGTRPAVLSSAQRPTPATHPRVPGTGTRWLYVGMLCPCTTPYTTFQGAHLSPIVQFSDFVDEETEAQFAGEGGAEMDGHDFLDSHSKLATTAGPRPRPSTACPGCGLSSCTVCST